MFTNFRPVLRKCLSETIFQSHKVSKVFSCLLSTSNSCWRNFRSPIKFTKPRIQASEEEETPAVDYDREDSEFDDLIDKAFLFPGSGHQVFVIQPFIKRGRLKKRNTTPDLQLLESLTLIKTLRRWKVVDDVIISVENFDRKFIFGKGNLLSLTQQIRSNSKISAVFISVNTLSLIQQLSLQEVFQVPVFDRYSIIMHILKEHAQTKEAKLQVQLAQLPYLWMVLRGINEGIGHKLGIPGSYIGGEGPKLLEVRKEVFKRRHAKLKRELEHLREQRQDLRKTRQRKGIPVVAVLGYTNAGKTSLIKALTNKKSLVPQDYLFATLDVTCHLGPLPSGLQVFYVDTLGFISDIPTYLIESFVSTLEDATQAHVIIHVRDISHPDTVHQNDNVIKTLKDLNLSQDLMDNVITVGNKVDLVKEKDLENYKDMILISCTTCRGIDVLRQEIEKKVLASTDNIQMVIRVQSGSEEYDWLHTQSTVVEESPDPSNNQYMFVKVIISSSALAKFKHDFITNYKKKRF